MSLFHFCGDDIYYSISEAAVASREHALVCVHGWGNSHTIWDKARAYIKDHPLIVVDLPGFGGSTFNTRVKDYYAYASDALAALVSALPFRRYSLLGNSIGGLIALYLVHKTPDVIANLMLDSSPIFGAARVSLKPKLFGMNPILSYPLLQITRLPQITAPLIASNLYQTLAADEYRNLLLDFCRSNRSAMYIAMHHLISLDTKDLVESLPERIATVYIYGDKSKTIDASLITSELKKTRSSAKIASIPNAAHYPQLERPELYYKIISTQLAS